MWTGKHGATSISRAGTACCRAMGRMDELSLETGPLITDVYKGGAIVTHRTDLMIGGSSSTPGGVGILQLV